jgi:hypothetical protein
VLIQLLNEVSLDSLPPSFRLLNLSGRPVSRVVRREGVAALEVEGGVGCCSSP